MSHTSVHKQEFVQSKNGSLPEGFTCPACEYDLGGAESRRCPECGRDVTDVDMTLGNAPSVKRRLLRLQLTVSAVLMIVTGLVGVLAQVRWSVSTMSAILVAIAAFGSIGGGLLVAHAAKRVERIGWSVRWLKSQPWLHLPSLVVVCGKSALALADVFYPRDMDVQLGTVVLTVLLVMMAVVVGVSQCVVAWSRTSQGMPLSDRTARVYFPLVAFFVLFLSPILLGTAVGFLFPLK